MTSCDPHASKLASPRFLRDVRPLLAATRAENLTWESRAGKFRRVFVTLVDRLPGEHWESTDYEAEVRPFVEKDCRCSGLEQRPCHPVTGAISVDSQPDLRLAGMAGGGSAQGLAGGLESPRTGGELLEEGFCCKKWGAAWPGHSRSH